MKRLLRIRLAILKEILSHYGIGVENTDHLCKSQKVGRERVIRKVIKGEFHISPADRGKSIVVML